MSDVKAELKLQEMLDELKKHSIKYGTPEYEAYLAAGYPEIGTAEHATEIVTGRDKDHSAFPWDLYMKAKAYLAAYNYKPQVVKSPGRPAVSRT